MKYNNVIIGGVLFVFLALLSSCSTTTKILSSWKDDNYAGGNIKSIMIVGVSKDKSDRTTFERTFVEQFKRKGVEAVASIDIISKDEESSYNTIKGAAEKLGVETVMVVHLVSVDKDVTTSVRSSSLGSYYGSHTDVIARVQLESNIYETKTEKLIWSAQSRTITYAYDSEVKFEFIKGVCKSLLKELRKNGLLN